MAHVQRESVGLGTYFLMRYSVSSITHCMSGLSGVIVAAKGIPDPWITLVSFTAPGLGGFATLLLNDYFDRKVDQVIRPWRPIPAGKMRVNQYITLAFTIITLGFILTISLFNLSCLLIALVAAVSAVSYNVSKSRRYIGQLAIALSSSLSFIYGYAASKPALEPVPLVLTVGLMSLINGLSYSFFTSIPDAVEDKIGGAVTVSVKFGSGKAAKMSFATLICEMILGFLPFTLGYLNLNYLLTFLTARITLLGVHAFFVKNPGKRLADFVRNTYSFTRMVVAIAFPFGIFPYDLGIIFIPLLCLLIIVTPIRYFTSAFELKY